MSFVEPGPTVGADRGDACAVPRGVRRRRRPWSPGRPGRVNLIGEHTDYNRGLVLPVALAARDVRRGRRRATTAWCGSRAATTASRGPARIDALGPGAGRRVGGVRRRACCGRCARTGFDVPGLDVLVHGTVPLGAGLSSSAALECSRRARGVRRCSGWRSTTTCGTGWSRACIRAETEVAGAPTGGMDQTISLLARGRTPRCSSTSTPTTRAAVPLGLADAGLTLLVTDTRVQHALVDGGYAARRADCEAAAAALGVPSLRQATLDAVAGARRRAGAPPGHPHRHRDRAGPRRPSPRSAPATGPRSGGCFAASHVSMRDDFEISCPELDLAVATAVEAGAIGARMTGGGFGGSSIALVPTERLDAVVRAIDTAFVAAGLPGPAAPARRAERCRGRRVLRYAVWSPTADFGPDLCGW